MLNKPVVLGGARTATGKFGQSLAGIPAPELGAAALNAAIKKARIAPEDIDEVIIGTHFQAGTRSNPARQAAIYAGLPDSTPAFTPNKNCATALKAINLAAQSIMLGDNVIVAAGGCEAMSRIPYLLAKARFGYRMGTGELLDGMLYDGLVDPFENYHMGLTAENVAEKYNISREAQDEFALRSHLLAEKAWNTGKYDSDIVPVEVKVKKKNVTFSKDETYMENTVLETFQAAKPYFKPEGGTVTSLNSSPLNDGACVLILADETTARERSIPPLARYVTSAAAALSPAYMGYAPVLSVQKLLKKTSLKIEDIGLWEVNEAFAAQSVAVCRDLGLNMDFVNVNGGSIALGHPVGSTGARLSLTLIGEMRRRGVKYGIVTLCIGGGQGLSTLYELCE